MASLSHKFLQVNLNHCARAQDLLMQTMAERAISIAVACEPYYIPPANNWIGDRDGLVALIIQTAMSPLHANHIRKGNGYVAAHLGDMMVLGAYFSPNRPLSEFESFLNELSTVIACSRARRTLVAGDLNAKSTAWGSPTTDARGELVEDWMVTTGLSVSNRGSAHTCVRQQGGSIVDVTLTNAFLANNIYGWEVLEDVETLSDHKYIQFSVSSTARAPDNLPRPHTEYPRWALRRLDKEILVEAAIIQAWSEGTQLPNDIETEVQQLGEAMSRVCDAAMPRAKPHKPRRSVYWWSVELAQLRTQCVSARRQYTRYRRRRQRSEAEEAELYRCYREATKTLQVAIANAKARAQEELLETLNNDPWGKPYKMVRKKLRPWAPPLTQSLQQDTLNQVIDALFPARVEHTPPLMRSREGIDDNLSCPEITEAELGAAVLRIHGKNTAPGLDGIPCRVWTLALGPLEPKLRGLFNRCMQHRHFPKTWKTGKLVLVLKDGRPVESPSAYRPIVLLDEVAKLFERIIATRITKHLEDTGPDISEHQFGFRRNRSTIDAIATLKAKAIDVVSRGDVILAVSLDIANAFNTLPWGTILEALRYHGVPQYLRRLVKSYLSDRSVKYPTHDSWQTRSVVCGVPQGSVLGPLLWNIGYDWVLRAANLRGVSVICYADDTLVMATGKNHSEATILATAGVQQIVTRIRRLGLEVALSKSEAICFHGPRKAPPAGSRIVVDGVSIGVGSTMRYLGLVLDSRWNFREHFTRMAPKLVGAAAALSRLLPNVSGPHAGCRRLFAGVVRSMALYGAPIWVDALSAHNQLLLRRPQRVIATRIARGYRTISCDAACVIAGTPPWELEAQVLADVYQRVKEKRDRGHHPPPDEIERWRNESQTTLLHRWERKLQETRSGHRTITAIRPVLEKWMNRKHGIVTYHLTQVLTGHGCFGKYLCQIARREQTPACHHCECPEDTAEHTLASCPSWREPREHLVAVVGENLSLPTLIQAMVDNEEAWLAMSLFCIEVMAHKEAAERSREEDPAAHNIRRRRAGRRRTNYGRSSGMGMP